MKKYKVKFSCSADKKSLFLIPSIHLNLPYQATEGMKAVTAGIIWLGFSADVLLFIKD